MSKSFLESGEYLINLDKNTEDMLFFGFRYCLSRNTGAVTVCCNFLIKNWSKLSNWTKDMIKKEIIDEFNTNPTNPDILSWEKILTL